MSRLVVVSNRIALPDDKNRALAVWPSASWGTESGGGSVVWLERRDWR